MDLISFRIFSSWFLLLKIVKSAIGLLVSRYLDLYLEYVLFGDFGLSCYSSKYFYKFFLNEIGDTEVWNIKGYSSRPLRNCFSNASDSLQVDMW